MTDELFKFLKNLKARVTMKNLKNQLKNQKTNSLLYKISLSVILVIQILMPLLAHANLKTANHEPKQQVLTQPNIWNWEFSQDETIKPIDWLLTEARRHPNLTLEEAILADYLADDLQYLTFGIDESDLYYDGLPLHIYGPLDGGNRLEVVAVLKKGIHPDLRQTEEIAPFMLTDEEATRNIPNSGAIRITGNLTAHGENGFWMMFETFEINVNGSWQTAFCINFPDPSPATGTSGNLNPFNNVNVARTLWFGYQGGANTWQTLPGGRAEAIAATKQILTWINTNNFPENGANHPSGSRLPATRTLWSRVNGATVIPNGDVTTNRGQNPELSVSVVNGVQRSQNVTINAYSGNRFNIPVPSGVNLINESRAAGNVTNGGAAVVRGGETIRFEAPLSTNVSVNTGQVRGSVRQFQPLRAQTGGASQNLGLGIFIDPTSFITLRANFTPQTNEISLRKEDLTNGNGLAGSQFRVQWLNASGNWANDNQITWHGGMRPNDASGNQRPVAWRTTPANGNLRITGLRRGARYRVCEMVAPNGFTLEGATITGSDVAGNCFEFDSRTSGGHSYPQRIFRNQPIRNVTIRHIGQSGQSLLTQNNFPRDASERNYWLDGDMLTSSPLEFFHQPTNRYWRYDHTEGNNATVNADMIVTHIYSRPVNIHVIHIDAETNQIIQETMITDLYANEEIQLCPLDYLIDEAELLLPTPQSEACIDLVLPDVDELQIVEFSYTRPALTINVDRFEVTTGQETMQAVMTLSQSAIKAEALGEIQYRVTIKNQTTELTTATAWRAFQDFKPTKSINLPTHNMEIGAEATLVVNVEFRQLENEIPRRVKTQTVNLETTGYRASERVLTNADMTSGGQVNYTAPARTIVTRNGNEFSEVLVRTETVHFNFTKTQRTRTGYGVATPLTLNFTSEINDEMDVTVDLITRTSLADNYIYEEYDIADGLMSVPLELMKHAFEETTNETITTSHFEFQQIWVQRSGRGIDGTHDFINGGELFSQNQIDNGHPALINEVRDGYRRFYIPIWHDLGIYEFNYITNEIGRNLIRIDMKQAIDVFAFMYAWMGSPTINDDALLMVPVFSCTANPSGWTDEMIKWLRGEQCDINPGGFGQ